MNEPYRGDIVVKSEVSAPPTPWTLVPGDYVVVAWAGDTLIAYEEREDGNLDVIMLSGPGDVRRLASSAQVVAISPDGTQAILDSYGSGSSVATLIDLSTGKELARLDFSETMEPDTSQPLDNLGYGGSWVDDRVIAQAGPGFVVLDTSDDSLTLDGVLRLGDEFPLGAIEPQFMSGSTTRFVAWAPKLGKGGKADPYLYVYLDCSLETFECLVGPSRGDRMFNPIRNPSRPIAEEGQ